MPSRRQRCVLQELNLGRREEYDVLDKRRGRDPEMGGKQVGPALRRARGARGPPV